MYEINSFINITICLPYFINIQNILFDDTTDDTPERAMILYEKIDLSS